MGIMMITEKAYAKINLTLSVGEKREDGYHEIDSVMHSISLCDEVTLTEAGGLSLSIKEGLAPGGKANLMWDAAELFFRETGFSGGVHMELVKQIPSEAGMGGGSSDAAAISQAGIPGATFAAMDPTPARYYHTRLDTADNLDPKMIEAGLNLALETTYLFDKEGLKESY